VVRSSLGGNLRVGYREPLTSPGATLVPVGAAANPNAFFTTVAVPSPVVTAPSAMVQPSNSAPAPVWSDLPTMPGSAYTLEMATVRP
jgi:hypothetical protein